MTRQCLSRRIASIEELRSELAAWEDDRNHREAKVNWQFTTKDARIKLVSLYPDRECETFSVNDVMKGLL